MVTIEDAKPGDAQRIWVIQKQAYLSEAKIYNDYTIPPLTQTLEQLRSDLKSLEFYVAKVAGEIVASVNIRIEGVTGHIGRLIVAPQAQNQGLGSMLMHHVEGSHSNLQAFELFTGHKSERNLRFYQKLGYVEYKRQPIHESLTLVFLRKLSAPHKFGSGPSR